MLSINGAVRRNDIVHENDREAKGKQVVFRFFSFVFFVFPSTHHVETSQKARMNLLIEYI